MMVMGVRFLGKGENLGRMVGMKIFRGLLEMPPAAHFLND